MLVLRFLWANTSSQAHVRTVAREYLGRETRTAKFPDGPSRSEKAGAKRGVVGPDPDHPRLDVSGKEMRSPWNKQIAVMFSHYYVSLQNALTRDRNLVEEVFLSHIPAMCKQAQKLDSNTKKVDIGVVDNRRRGRRREVRSRDNILNHQHLIRCSFSLVISGGKHVSRRHHSSLSADGSIA